MNNIELQSLINNFDGVYRPKLLLHACCAPCSSYVLEYINKYFDITLYYYNPNIYPESEYDIRSKELVRLVDMMNMNLPVVVESFDPKEYYDSVSEAKDTPEGGERCRRCFALRLGKSANYAKMHGFDYFTTTLSISPYKDSDTLNDIGKDLANACGVPYLISSFKENGGYARSIMLSHKYGLYRQNYCGCVYSYNEAKKRKADRLLGKGE